MPDVRNWTIIGRGDERICYQHPDDPGRCIKLSRREKAKQTRRELRYFRYLQRRRVPFTLIPEFFGVVEDAGFVGIEQQLVLDDQGNLPPNVAEYLAKPLTPKQKSQFWAGLGALKAYLLAYNVVPCDLVMSNLLVIERSGATTIMLIDGLGSSEFIPLPDYIPWLGRRKIRRKWVRFMEKMVEPRFMSTQERQL
ncbi:PhoP regulatory network protein YrbL [Halomonas shengliensis]|uniref:PhoP regulatory network protein YrbL n=1 Tax=Halomonas shengliensis TaxID=419597 RepID=A0A1H0FJZ4_9GAMM|nr:YrbL family protein [Halomonas shengliensis]SDN94842.1 PhoP regulatory network protein YrbL [Halomonas shengliensis]